MNANLDVLKAIEAHTVMRTNLDSGEKVTIIAHPQIVRQIKEAIARQEIFQNDEFYKRVIFQENPDGKIEELAIIPDSIIEDSVDKHFNNFINTNQDMIEKMTELNEELKDVDEEVLLRIANEPEGKLTEEELAVKKRIQDKMIPVGKILDDEIGKDEANSLIKDVAKSSLQLNIGGKLNDQKEQ